MALPLSKPCDRARQPGSVRAVQSGNIWIVEADVNGDGTADLVINAVSADPLVAGDFIL